MARKKQKKILIIIPSVILLMLLGFSIYCYEKITSKIDTTESVELSISNNSGINDIIQKLNEQGLLEPNWFFRTVAKSYARMTGKFIFAGVHKFPATLTNGELVVALFSGKNLLVKKVTFPEGITIKRFASILKKQMDIDSMYFVQLCNSREFIKKFNIDATDLEGYLMPATFNFFVNIMPEKIIETLVQEQKKVWQKYENDAKKIGFNYHKTLTLASIIEAETPVIDERKLVSGVYHNRLRKGMLLQADPTVQYALGMQKKRLLYSDLEIDSRYNTYKYVGLPPGPINSPSPTSIEAAVNPMESDYLFFVAVGDGSNRHNFSKNFAEHQQQVANFRKNRK
jgi:UPF0755 protein